MHHDRERERESNSDAYSLWQDAMADAKFAGQDSESNQTLGPESQNLGTISLDEFTVKPFDAPFEEAGDSQGLSSHDNGSPNADTVSLDEFVVRPFEMASDEGAEWNLTKVSGPLGSNEGGWYENPEGERFYAKFYENPDQGRVEFIANAIYEKLGIKAAHSRLIEIDGREAVVSSAIPNAEPTGSKRQQESEDVRNGFVADAYLANWDVVGLLNDNIIVGEDGLYRIDNGGSLIFRAQGGNKDYSPDSIPELWSMLVPTRPTGEVFAGITGAEIREQAQELLSKLSPEAISEIVDQSGLSGESRKRVLDGLLGRREFLEKAYGETKSKERRPRRKIHEIIDDVNSREIAEDLKLRPRTEIKCDHDHIENQRIDVINKQDQGVTEFRFKLRELTDEMFEMIALSALDEDGKATLANGLVLERGRIFYDNAHIDTNSIFTAATSYTLCDAYTFRDGEARVFIAEPGLQNGFKVDTMHYGDGQMRSAIGLITVDIPSTVESETMENTLRHILENDLGIPDALGEISEADEREYKIARYRWQHKLADEPTPEQMSAAEKLEPEEVFPGYTTFVEKGKHLDYLHDYGQQIRAIHGLNTYDVNKIYQVLTQGLMSTSERFSRGLLVEGMSSEADMKSGGADSAFTRVVNNPTSVSLDSDAMVVLKPELFDRTDWYSYLHDTYGTTNEEKFKSRLSPDQLFASISHSDDFVYGDNEQMFRTGIGAQYIESVIVQPYMYDKIVSGLRKLGLEEVNGRPIEELIIAYHKPTAEHESEPSSEPASDYVGYKEGPSPEEVEKEIQDIIDGKNTDVTFEHIIDLVQGSADDYEGTQFLVTSMVTSVISHGGDKEAMASGVAEFFKDTFDLSDLAYLAENLAPPYLKPSEMEFIDFAKSSLGIDFSKIYEEVLNSSQEGEPEEDGVMDDSPEFLEFDEDDDPDALPELGFD